ncbi:MAG: hypothetical protein JNL82_02280 [Myxococcales bacterium]|nr:hypothetical protein [Myxococcales bacterium]
MRRLHACLAPALLACSPPAAPPADAKTTPEPAKSAPARTEPAKTEPAKSETAKSAPAAEPSKKVYTPEELDKIGPRPEPVPPLTQEEIDLLAMDPKTLDKDMRVKQAYARRRKILQNPDSPMARQIEALRLAALRGELAPPVLPDRTPPPETKQ